MHDSSNAEVAQIILDFGFRIWLQYFHFNFLYSKEFLSLNVLFAASQIDGQVGNGALKFKREWM